MSSHLRGRAEEKGRTSDPVKSGHVALKPPASFCRLSGPECGIGDKICSVLETRKLCSVASEGLLEKLPDVKKRRKTLCMAAAESTDSDRFQNVLVPSNAKTSRVVLSYW